MRMFWKAVLLSTALLICTPLVFAQQPTGSTGRSTSPAGTSASGTNVRPSSPATSAPTDTGPSRPADTGTSRPTDTGAADTPKATDTAPKVVQTGEVPIPGYKDPLMFWILCIFVSVLGVVFIYYAFVRKKDNT